MDPTLTGLNDSLTAINETLTAAVAASQQAGDTAWILASTALVFIMIPGVGYFYSGMARSKNALSLIFLSILSVAIVSVEWVVWGYSLTYSTTGSKFIGDLQWAFFRD